MKPRIFDVARAPDQSPKTVDIDEALDGGDVLPGLEMAVKEILPEEKPQSVERNES